MSEALIDWQARARAAARDARRQQDALEPHYDTYHGMFLAAKLSGLLGREPAPAYPLTIDGHTFVLDLYHQVRLQRRCERCEAEFLSEPIYSLVDLGEALEYWKPEESHVCVQAAPREQSYIMVICPQCGAVALPPSEVYAQACTEEAPWHCPACGREAVLDVSLLPTPLAVCVEAEDLDWYLYEQANE